MTIKARLTGLLVLGLLGCQPAPTFPVLLEATAEDREAVAGVRVWDERGHALGRTDEAGRALLTLPHIEGEAVVLRLRAPDGMQIDGGDRLRVLLRRSGPLSGPTSGILSQQVTLRRGRVPYVIFVRAPYSGLQVVVNGVPRGQISEAGVGMIRHEGAPGESVTLRLLTHDQPRLVPRDPEHTLVLPGASALLLWRQELGLRRPPSRPRRPHRPPTAI